MPLAGERIEVAGDLGRRILVDHLASFEMATERERFEALARTLRDRLAHRWVATTRHQDLQNPKRVYYLSMEFLPGRMLVSNIINARLQRLAVELLDSAAGGDWTAVVESEPDAGLGNGGLGRLAACFIESMATLEIPAMGYGLRYEYGVFRQEIENGYQIERPDPWLRYGDPWEIRCGHEGVQVPLGCSFRLDQGNLEAVPGNPSYLLGQPLDRPVVGYGGRTINTLRLWTAVSPDVFHFGEFNHGDFFGAIVNQVVAETVTRVLYPDDSTLPGRVLRFVQEYFLVVCSVADIAARFRQANADWERLPEKVAIQLNDTHPAMAVAELMRILVDEAHLGWERSWDLTVRTLAYTNHTLLPEALERWPIAFFELICPRLLEIIYEINHRFMTEVRDRYPSDEPRQRRMSLVEESPVRQVRMAHLAIIGSHSVNGVAAIHSDLLRTRVLRDFAEMYPSRFNNKTNGVTPRRWLLMANPDLSQLITEAIGDGWITDLHQLQQLESLADDAGFRGQFHDAKLNTKRKFSDWLRAETGEVVDPESIFDSQIKRIHEYKRQLLNVLHVVMLYRRLKETPSLDLPPRTFFFAGKAAPAYRLAKLVIKLINCVAQVIRSDGIVRDRLKIVFLPNYNVSLAERLIAASNVSEQISTAGYEASGTGNMKFMMNGALTVGTRDGATIEIANEVGEHNLFLFGLTAEQVMSSRGWYDSQWHYENEPEIRHTLDLLFSDHFSPQERGIFEPIQQSLFAHGDFYMHLADLTAYAEAQERVSRAFVDQADWDRRSIMNVARSGQFSSDRTIHEYAREIWDVSPCPVLD